MKFKLITIIAAALIYSSCNTNTSTTISESIGNDTIVTKPQDEILTEFNQKIEADSSNAQLYFLRSKYYVQKKSFGLAKDDIERALAIDSLNTNYYVLLADIHFFRNESRKTKDALTKCLRIDPKNYDANFKLGELMLYVRQFEEALVYTDAIYPEHKKDLKLNFLKAMILKDKGDTTQAINYFRNCIDIQPDYFDAFEQLAYIEKARNKPDAMDYFNSALKIKPQSITALYGRGLTFQNKGDFDNAIKDYNTIIQLKPSYVDAYFNLGFIHQVNLKLYREALKYYSQALGYDQTNVRAIFNSGNCYENLGDIENARLSYQKCIDLAPEYKPAREALKRVMK
jgi:tetratricopeptide (TPR) repeat protein